MNQQPSRQFGSSLLELLIAVTISLVAVSAMVSLMAGTLGAGKESLENSRLTNELRATMQIISRDLRRANYNEEFLDCIGETRYILLGQPICGDSPQKSAHKLLYGLGGTVRTPGRKLGNHLRYRSVLRR